MKTVLFTLAFSISAVGCSFNPESIFSINFGMREGKGPLITRETKMNFDEIQISQSLRAEIYKAEMEKIVVTAPQDIFNEVLLDNRGGKLHIHFRPHENISAKKITIKIYAKDFSALQASSSARLELKETFTQDRTVVKVSSSGSIKGNLEANNLTLTAASSGNYSGKIWAVNMDAEASSSGSLHLSGKAKTATLQSSSSGLIDAGGVTVQQADLQASSSGTIKITATDLVRSRASSSGNILVRSNGGLQMAEKNENSGGSITVQ